MEGMGSMKVPGFDIANHEQASKNDALYGATDSKTGHHNEKFLALTRILAY